jgi:Amt family ammonium transporter
MLTGVFSAAVFGGSGIEGSIGGQVWTQAIGVIVTIVYTGVVSLIILKALDAVIGLRVAEEDESEGLDLALHQERGYNIQ